MNAGEILTLMSTRQHVLCKLAVASIKDGDIEHAKILIERADEIADMRDEILGMPQEDTV